jgi:type II secretory pathway pseudopilin PulG
MKGKRQEGVVLWVSLVVLVIMMAATVIIMRNTSVGQNVAGNLGFKQNADTVGEHGAEAALAWLIDPAQTPVVLEQDQPGYYATWNGGAGANPTFDPLTFDWDGAGAIQSTANDGTGNSVFYVIHRMCALPGPVTAVGQECSFPDYAVGSSHDAPGPTAILPTKPLFRLSMRVVGPRGTESHLQTMIYER